MKIIFSVKNALGVAFLISLFVLIPAKIYCQESKNTKEKNGGNPPALTIEQKAKIKDILSAYKPSSLTAEQAKAIHGKFREAGIHAGPETRDAIIASGFDAEKLRDLDPPSNREKNNMNTPPAKEERMKLIREKVIDPLSVNKTQQDVISNAFLDFFKEIDEIVKSQPDQKGRPDKAKIEPLEKKRNEKVKQVLSPEQFSKFLELEKAARPQK